jgi:hypothetical protein
MFRQKYGWHDRCNWFSIGLQIIKCILYTLHVIHYTVCILFPFYCERITEKLLSARCTWKHKDKCILYILYRIHCTIPPFLLYKKILECTLWILKNIPVSIYAQYKCLLFLFNKQFTTHPLTVNFSNTALVYSEKSHCPLAIFRVKARLGCFVTGHICGQLGSYM